MGRHGRSLSPNGDQSSVNESARAENLGNVLLRRWRDVCCGSHDIWSFSNDEPQMNAIVNLFIWSSFEASMTRWPTAMTRWFNAEIQRSNDQMNN